MVVEPLNRVRDTSMRILPVRKDCVLVELADLGETLALLDVLKDAPIEGTGEIIPAARTLLINFEPETITLDALQAALAAKVGAERKDVAGRLVEIPVRYDGEDLHEVAGLLGMSADEVIRRHVESTYTVAFTGFAPGFAYLAGGDPRLTVPRRSSPRTHVPAGAVGLAGEFSGVYPKTSPGGWQLIGKTPLAMFDIDRDPASLLQPGCRVRFHAIAAGAPVEITTPVSRPSARVVAQGSVATYATAIEVLGTGLPAYFQDLGRSGQASLGISRSGSADRGSFKEANRLVGNAVNTPAIELTLGGFSFRMRGRSVMAVTGAHASFTITDVSGTQITPPHAGAVAVDDGDTVSFAMPAAGVRTYIAFRGGLSVEPVLGSAATDTLAQIGPAPIAKGDIIPVMPVPQGAVVGEPHVPAFAMPVISETIVLDVILGPRTNWFTQEAISSFLSQEWSVTPQSSRVGIRLQGFALERAVPGELPSEATVMGAIQVPASGQPVLFLADHPLTGGYPVIANVTAHDLDRAGQVPVGARIRFNAINSFEPRIIPGRQS